MDADPLPLDAYPQAHPWMHAYRLGKLPWRQTPLGRRPCRQTAPSPMNRQAGVKKMKEFLPPATKLGQGYVFTGICHSVNRGRST